MYIDTHCHLSKTDNIKEIISKCHNCNVDKIIICGCDKDSIKESIQIALEYKEIYLSLGFHPEFASTITNEDIIDLKNTIISTNKVVAIGEIGLDFHYGIENKEEQIKLFESQLSMASDLHIPVIIHSRDATELTYNILSKYNLKGSIHCFSGSYEMAQKYIKLGYKIGIGGVITFKNSKLGDTVKKLKITDIILETDSPYLAPSPHRGEKNAPYNIPIIASYISNITNMSEREVATITTNTVYELFDIK